MTRPDTPPDATITYRQHYTRCGKPDCPTCGSGEASHGPYWYAHWQQDGRRRSRYLGKHGPVAGGTEAADRPGRPDGTPPAAGPVLRVRTLGAFTVWRGSERIPAAAWSRHKAAALFKVLLGAPGHRLRREQIVEALWPDAAPGRGDNSLRFTLHQLRAIVDPSQMPDSYIQARDGLLELSATLHEGGEASEQPVGWLDATAFAGAADAALAGEEIAACRAALDLYTGPYLPEVPYEDWAVGRREELAQLHLGVLVHHARIRARLDMPEETADAWQAVLRADPCHEAAAYALMRLLAGRDQVADALRVYRTLAEALRADLQVLPATAIERLERQLHARQGEAAPDPRTGAGVPDAEVPDAHVREVPPAAAAPDPPAPRGTNLPVAVTSFIGRQREQSAIRDVLASARLLTLTGTGGAGKTRLAVQVAGTLQERFPDGVWLVGLAPLSNPDLVPVSVATALGLTQAELGLGGLLDFLRPKRLLLVLDNCEHLLDACAELASAVLAACPAVRLLATSRESLNIPGETTYQVPPLSIPTLGRAPGLEDMLQYEAVQLFLDRAGAHRHGFALTARNAQAVATICARLDGSPLAIELAAARVRALPVEEIATRLDDRFRLLTGGPRTVLPRHQTLRAALDWSHDLLSEPERILLRRLAVFAGGCTLQAAESVCANGAVGDWEVLDLLTALEVKSLIEMAERNGGARYRLLETMRQYAQERLAASGEMADIHARHLRWCIAQAEQGVPALSGPGQRAWLDHLAVEHDNLRAALSWSLLLETRQHAGVGAALRLAGLLWPFWWRHGHLHEGRRWLEDVLAITGNVRSADRAHALDGAGVLAADQGDYVRAAALHEESLALWRDLGDSQGIAAALNNGGSVLQQQGDYARASALHEESLALWRDLGDRQGIAKALNQLGCLAWDDGGDYDRATALLTESLALRRDPDDTRGIAIALNNLGLVAFQRGDYDRAAALLIESLALRRDLGDTRGVAISLGNIGHLASRQGDKDRATALLTESLALRRDLGDTRGIAECLEGLAAIAIAQGQAERAAHLFGAASAAQEAVGLPRLPATIRATLDQAAGAARMVLGEAAFAAAWAWGRALGLEEAISYAGV